MFTVGSLLPVDGVEPGSTLLVVGPPMSGKRELVMELLAQGLDDEAVAVVSTDASADDIRASMADYADRAVHELPLGIVDCAGDARGTDDLGPLDSRVNSPADLTGLGMELTTLLEQLYTTHSRKLRFGLLSLTTMSMYSSPDQVVRFLHAVTTRVTEANAFGLVVAHSDTMEEAHLQRLRSFVDGVVEVRTGDDGSELRVQGVHGRTTDWVPLRTRQRTASDDAERQPATDTADAPVADSLRALFDTIRADAPTLTVCNYDGPPEELAVVERYFERQGVDVREATLDVAEPRSVALLHHGENLLGSESMTALRGAIDIDAATGEAFAQRRTSDLLTNLQRSVFGARASDKGLLIDVSHSIELLANRTGVGRIHAGFQRLSNLLEDEQASRIYERLSASGVDVHVYGAPDSEATVPGVTLHEADTEELRESWFVVYDGGGDPDRQAALLTIEDEDSGQYDGFWTYDSDIVGQLDRYLTATYLDASTVNEQRAN